MPHSHSAEEIHDNVIVIVATVVKEVRDYLIPPPKPLRKSGTENNSFIFHHRSPWKMKRI